MVINTVIIDDETHGRKIIREYLEGHPEIIVKAECRDAHEALVAIENFRPELIFLDIHLPEINGFELLELIEEKPLVIFSTAYDKYAIRAFEVNAIDYLLKPYDQERFDLALARAKRNLQHRQEAGEKLETLLNNLQTERVHWDRFLIRQSGQIVIINAQEITHVEAMEDYVNIHTSRAEYLVQHSLSRLETKLNPEQFVRVHRSYIVNIEAVKTIEQLASGRYCLITKQGKSITISRSGMKRLKEFIL